MTTFRRGASVATLALTALLLSGCSGGEDALKSGRALPPIPAAPEPGYPMVVASADGQEVRIPKRPLRIVPANAAAVDMVTALVGRERVAGLPQQAFTYASLALEPERWSGVPTFKIYEVERLLELGPDLVLCDPWQEGNTTSALRQAGVPVVVIPPVESVGDLERIIPLYGALVGEEQTARSLLEDCRRRIASLAASAPSRSHLRALVYTNQGTGGWTSGLGTTADEIIRLAGMVNSAAEANLRGHFPIDHERLITLDPDVILLPSSLHDPTTSPSSAILHSDPALRRLRAVERNAIVVLPVRLLSAGSHALVDAAERLVQLVEGLALSPR